VPVVRAGRWPTQEYAKPIMEKHTLKPELSLYNSEEQAVLNEQNPLPSQLFLPSQDAALLEANRPIREDTSSAEVPLEVNEYPKVDEMNYNGTDKSSKRVTRRGPMDEMRQLVRYTHNQQETLFHFSKHFCQ